MAQHKNPLERDPNQPGTQPDAATDGASSIGDDAGVFDNSVSGDTGSSAGSGANNRSRGAQPDTADSGMDQGRSAGIQAAETSGQLPPPSAFRPDSVVRATGADARREMQQHANSDHDNDPNFTKGHNAPTSDQARTGYTVEQMDSYLEEAPRGVFPDTPGGAGATPLSADRGTFIGEVARRGHFPSNREAEKWTRAVFNALRHRAIEVDDALATEFASVVRVGEAPEVQVEEMMWGGDFVDRFSRLVCILQDWTKAEFYQQVAEEGHETVDDPWVDAAIHSFFGVLKQSLGDDADHCKLGQMQDVWERA